MAKIANNKCKKIYLTDDNPRNESPRKIRNELSKYIDKDKKFNIGNRALAIKEAIKRSEPQEIVLMLEKVMRKSKYIKKKYIIFLIKKL